MVDVQLFCDGFLHRRVFLERLLDVFRALHGRLEEGIVVEIHVFPRFLRLGLGVDDPAGSLEVRLQLINRLCAAPLFLVEVWIGPETRDDEFLSALERLAELSPLIRLVERIESSPGPIPEQLVY